MNPNGMRLAAAATLLSLSAAADLAAPDDGLGIPRCDRHGKRMTVEPTQFTTSKKKSSSLQKLLRK